MRVHKDTPHPLQASQQLAAAGSVSSLLGLHSPCSSLPPSPTPQDTLCPHTASQAVLPLTCECRAHTAFMHVLLGPILNQLR